MSRLEFEMRPFKDSFGKQDGFISRFTDGKGGSTDSWWSSPPDSIDHVGPEYLRQRHRHPNSTVKHDKFIKRRYKEEMNRLKEQHDGT